MTHSGVRPPRTESTEVLEEPLGPMSASTSPGLQLPLMPNMICSAICSFASEAPSGLLALTKVHKDLARMQFAE